MEKVNCLIFRPKLSGLAGILDKIKEPKINTLVRGFYCKKF